jgi:hypothetical protein
VKLNNKILLDVLNQRADEAAKAGRLRQLMPMLEEIARRRLEAIALYTPFPAAVPFHQSMATWRILDGSNKSGKTTAACAEDAMAVLGLLPGKYPIRNGTLVILGQKGRHLSDPLYKILCQPGAFYTIRDEVTRLIRSVRPDANDPTRLDPYDVAYREKWQPAPPFLPDQLWGGTTRRVATTAFEKRSENVPAQTTILSTGWKILWRSSEALPDQGGTYNAAHVDEQIESDDWFNEIARGMMLDPGGITPRAIWSATPQNCHHLLQEMRERAEKGDPEVEAFQLFLKDNFIIRSDRKAAFEALLSEEEQDTRIHGIYAITGLRIYPMFRMDGGDEANGCEPFDIPEDWTRYFVIDPGRGHCGVLFIAVDPEEKHRWIYDGADLKQPDSVMLAKFIKERQGTTKFECGLIDNRMGRQTSPLDDHPVAYYHWQALMDAGVQIRRKGNASGFIPGCDKIEAREEALRGWMRVREEGPFAGTPLLKISRGRIPKLERQLRNAHDESRKSKEARRKTVKDLTQCAEYAAAGNLYYWPSEPIDGAIQRGLADTAWAALESKRKRRRKNGALVLAYGE